MIKIDFEKLEQFTSVYTAVRYTFFDKDDKVFDMYEGTLLPDLVHTHQLEDFCKHFDKIARDKSHKEKSLKRTIAVIGIIDKGSYSNCEMITEINIF